MSFEDVFVPKTWELRQFGFILALVQTNLYLFHNFARGKAGLEEVSKADYVRKLCEEMMENETSMHSKDGHDVSVKRRLERSGRGRRTMSCASFWSGVESGMAPVSV